MAQSSRADSTATRQMGSTRSPPAAEAAQARRPPCCGAAACPRLAGAVPGASLRELLRGCRHDRTWRQCLSEYNSRNTFASGMDERMSMVLSSKPGFYLISFGITKLNFRDYII